MENLVKKYWLALILLTLAVYGNALLNGFAGDDDVIIVKNTFYSDLSNLPKLFSKAYTTNPLYVDRRDLKDHGSGSVAYRPVLSLSYFMDHALWGKRAFGYHLTNVVLHTANVLLVFALFLLLMAKPEWAFFSAALFSVHPVHTEVVCAIGFRADLLATFFVLAGVLCWLRFRRDQGKIWGVFTLMAYFFALFSKESALFMPVLLWIYDRLYSRNLKNPGSQFKWGATFLLIGLFYLGVYLLAFPNPALFSNMFLGHSAAEHISGILRIWDFNIFSLFFPFAVTPVPPMYSFTPLPLTDVYSMLSLVLSAFVLGGFYFSLRKKNEMMFYLAWFLLFYIPISGLIATPNPVAYRFLYLPSIGFLGIAGYCLCQVFEMSFVRENLRSWLKILIIGSCGICTFFNNFLWKNDYTIARQWVKHYPENYRAQVALGIEYFRRFMFEKAVQTLEPVWQDFREIDSTASYCLAEGHFQLGHMAKAKYFFDELVKWHPLCSDGFFGLGKYFLEEGNPLLATEHFRKAIDLDPKDMYFNYIVSRSQGSGKDQKTAVVVVGSLKRIYGPRFLR